MIKAEDQTLKATDLRIGNLVQYQAHSGMQQIKVTSMNEDGIDLFSRDEYPHKIDADLLYKDVHGIELNEEWLIKLGFVKPVQDDLFGGFLIPINHEYRLRLIKSFGIWTWKQNDKHIVLLQYVHQLQNLIFALTGTELSIKP